MSEQFVGCTISIEVGGGLGFYQGEVTSICPSSQLIKLTKVLQNGKPISKTEVAIRAADIIDLKILNKSDCSQNDHQSQHSDGGNKNSPVHSVSAKLFSSSPAHETLSKLISGSSLEKEHDLKTSAQTVSGMSPANTRDSLPDSRLSGFLPIQTNTGSKSTQQRNGNFSNAPPMFKRKSRTSVGEFLANGSQSNDNRPSTDKSIGGSFPVSEYGYPRRNNDSSQTPNKRTWNNKQWKNYRDETTFGNPIDEDTLNTEFDFEKNLALFDKQAVMEEIENLKQPDVVRQADRRVERKYRCDENILASKPQSKRQIMVPPGDAGEVIYATDNGLLVPSVSMELRLNLLSTANQNGLTKSRQLEMMGRAATEVIISVIGGSHRLEPGNSHQTPVVVLLCGAHAQGAAGVNCGRQLESQGVQTVVITPPLPPSPTSSLLLSHEVQLYNLTSGKRIFDVGTLPSTVDLIVDARFDLQGNLGVQSLSWLNDTNSWASASRAPVVALDPPSDISLPLTPRIRLCPSLPLAYPPEKGKVYLLNLNIPQQVFTSLGIEYTSPFGAKMVVPLHPRE